MAYRRRQNNSNNRGSTFKEHNSDIDDDNNDVDNKITKNYGKNYSFPVYHNGENNNFNHNKPSPTHRNSSVYGAMYTFDSPSSPLPSMSSPLYYSSRRDANYFRSPSISKGSFISDNSPGKDSDDSKYGLWGVLARKAKSILEEDDQLESESPNRMKSTLNDSATGNQFYYSHQTLESGSSRTDNAKLRKGTDAVTPSVNNLGDTLGNAFEEGCIMEEHKTADNIHESRNKTADILPETRRIQIRRRGGGNSDNQDQAVVLQNSSWQRPVIQPVQTNVLANPETQLKASRDVAMATAAKAKLLLRELKTVKADLAFAKERSSQLEEENKRLRENREKGDNPADDDLIRLQLETLLAEKARLAHENSIYARENRFLREIVEYHQLTMQDVVYFDEGAEEVTEVYPFSIDDAKVLFSTPTSPISPSFLPDVSSPNIPLETKEHTSAVPKEESTQSSPATDKLVCTTNNLPEKAESSAVSILIQTVMADTNIKAADDIRPSIPTADNPTRPSASST